MPVITIAKWDLERLIGRSLSVEEIMDLMPRVKCEVEEIIDDTISYEAPHDRPDLFSVEGLARALRLLLGIGGNEFVFEDRGLKAYNTGVPRRPYIAFAIVEDLELDDESIAQLMNLQEKLHITYARDRRKASIGLYDLDKFRLPVYYELVDPRTTRFTPLDESREMNLLEILESTEKGIKYRHLLEGWEKLPVIRDPNGIILSMPPIINSEDTKVTSDTKRVLIDSTGLDPKIVVDMVTIMATSVAERSSSRKIIFVDTVMPDKNIIRAPRIHGGRNEFSIDDVWNIIGLRMDTELLIKALSKMGYRLIEGKDGYMVVETPPYRIDVLGWIDVVEDIAMAIGYEVIGEAGTVLPPSYHTGRMHPIEFLSRRLRLLMVGMGFVEVANYMMSNPWIQNKVFNDDKPLIKVSNPKMEKYTCLRRWLTPGLLEFVKANQEKVKEINIFEIGDVAIYDPGIETGTRIERRLGYAISHEKATLTDSLAVLRTLSETLGLKLLFKEKNIHGLLPERTASIIVGDVEIGFTGEIHPKTLAELGIEKPVVVAEIIINELLKLFSK